MCTSIAACKKACPQIEIGSFDLTNKGLAVNWSCLINDSANPFYVWTWAIGCSTFIPIDMQ